MITATTRKTKIQGMVCYLPALIIQDGEYREAYVSCGDPLVTKKDALEYAHIWKNDSELAGYVTYF